MLHVAHAVRASAIAGVGLFTIQPIAAGTLVYSCDPRTLQVLTEAEIAALPPAARDSVLRYCYRGRGRDRLQGAWYYCSDDSRFFNHADVPNCLWLPESEIYVAAEDIPAESELTCNYLDFSEPQDVPFLAGRVPA